MKQLIPYIGPTLLEKEDIEQLSEVERWKMLGAYAAILSFTAGFVVGSIVTVLTV